MAATPPSRRPSAILILGPGLLALALSPDSALGSHGRGHGHPGMVAMGPGPVHSGGYPGFGNPGQFNSSPGLLYGSGVGFPFLYTPSLFAVGGGFPPVFGVGTTFVQPPLPLPMNLGGGLRLPMPPRDLVDFNPPRTRRANPARAKELVEIGDRSFRAKNTKRAEEKYNLAAKADPSSPAPHVHLAQVSLARGDYSAAADHLRDAITVAADPGWLLNAPDIQAIFGEPGDFAKQLARLESHLQANPNDRDAWFVLGAESYLSGRSRQAFDVFQRLTDRRADEALTAFLDASRPPPAAAN